MTFRKETIEMPNFDTKMTIIVILSALCIGFIIVAVKKRDDIKKFFERDDVRNRIKQLILSVEADLSTPDGYSRLFKVCGYVWSFIPPSLKPFITVEMLCNVIQGIFDLLKENIDGHTVPVDKPI